MAQESVSDKWAAPTPPTSNPAGFGVSATAITENLENTFDPTQPHPTPSPPTSHIRTPHQEPAGVPPQVSLCPHCKRKQAPQAPPRHPSAGHGLPAPIRWSRAAGTHPLVMACRHPSAGHGLPAPIRWLWPAGTHPLVMGCRHPSARYWASTNALAGSGRSTGETFINVPGGHAKTYVICYECSC